MQSETLEIGNYELEPTQSNNSDSRELVFIGSTVTDVPTLIDNISGASEVIVLNDAQDELVQISEHLKDYQQLDAVHIVSHGESGQLSFGNAILNLDTLPEYEETIQEWSLALNEEADLLLYGCDVALDDLGNSFQALQKRLDLEDSAYQGLSKTEEDANRVITETLGPSNTNPIINTGTNRNSQNYVEVFNPSTGRGVRIINGKFDTFVNLK